MVSAVSATSDMPLSFDIGNFLSSDKVSEKDNALIRLGFYIGNMAAPAFDWYLTDWIACTGTRQARLIEATGYSKSKMSKLVSGDRNFDRGAVQDLARALNIEPYELLMHPEEAFRLRRLRQTALSIAADNRVPFVADAARSA